MNSSELERFHLNDESQGMEPTESGHWVSYLDHLTAVQEVRDDLEDARNRATSMEDKARENRAALQAAERRAIEAEVHREALEEDRDREAEAAAMWCFHSMGWATDCREARKERDEARHKLGEATSIVRELLDMRVGTTREGRGWLPDRESTRKLLDRLEAALHSTTKDPEEGDDDGN